MKHQTINLAAVRAIGASRAFLLIAAVMVAAATAQAQPVPSRHVWDVVQSDGVRALGKVPAAQMMDLDLVLPLRDPAGLDSLLNELYDPNSPSYRQFLTVEQFTARFGPTQADYDAVVEFAKAHGLKVTGGSRDGM